MKGLPRITANEVFSRLINQTANLVMSRNDLMNGTKLDPEGRNLDRECGYPEGEPTLDVYRHLYDRVGIATRAVNVHSSESWSVSPLIYETEDLRKTKFERVWADLCKKHAPEHYLERLDEISGIGRFGVMLIGVADGRKLAQPVAGIDEKGRKTGEKSEKLTEFLYLRPFPEDLVQIKSVEQDPNNPRYGQPTVYNLKLSDPSNVVDGAPLLSGQSDQDVHWTRIHHAADNCQSSDVFGRPRLKPIVNDLLDIRKVKGGSSEMFWKGAFPGISFETFPELAATAELDKDSVKKEIEAYSNGLQRYMRLVGMTAKSLAPQVADPTNHLTSLLQIVCATLQVPVKVFMGSESGHLASTQDSTAWNRRLKKRQDYYLTPKLIRPFVDRLMLMNVLPTADDYTVEWKDLNVLSDTDKAKISLQKAQSILQYVTSGAFALIPPRLFLELVLQFSPEECDAIVKASGGEDRVIETLKKMVNDAAGNIPATSGTNPEAKTGAGGRRNGLGK